MLPGSLSDVIQKDERRLPEEIIKIYGKHVLEALAYLHAKGTVYGDLKCDNVLVNSKGVAKLADFGSAFFFDDSCYRSGASRRSVAGTLNFIAPEVFKVSTSE